MEFKDINKTVKMDLVGLDSNAFALIGEFQKEARRQGWTNEEIELVRNKAMESDYNNVLQTLISVTEPTNNEEDY